MINRKILSFCIILAVSCGPEQMDVWKAIPCKLNIIKCSTNIPNTIDIRMLNEDGSINSKIQFEREIDEENEKRKRYKKDNF